MPTITIEELQKQNHELRSALEKLAAAAHYAAKDAGSFSHRGGFHNCPDEDCVYVRVLVGKVSDEKA